MGYTFESLPSKITQRKPIHTSQHNLRRVIHALRSYVDTHIGQHKKHLGRLNSDEDLPLPLKILAWQGEAIARIIFQKTFAGHWLIGDNQNLLHYWDSIAVKEGLIFDLLSNAGFFTALSRECKIPIPTPKLSVQLYFALIGNLGELIGPHLLFGNDHGKSSGKANLRAYQHLLMMITEIFWKYHFCRQYPQENAVKKMSTEVLRQQLQKKLQIIHKSAVELRESFHTTADSASFRLRYRLVNKSEKGAWQEEKLHTGTKLKTLKYQAYTEALSKYEALSK